MKLKVYRQKRDFTKTDEPLPIRDKGSKTLLFCVQKHDASRLHYDFRLELDGVLLSWAVPKGPSTNPADKRLAIHVEDHPMDYRTFEGIIPKGNYGAGTVLLWDEGTYSAVGAKSKAESEKKLRAGLAKGHLEFVLNGDKLKGKYNLIELKNGKEKNAWLLIKSDDDYVSTDDILEQDYSVKKKSKKEPKVRPGKVSKMPEWINPMLAQLIEKPFDDEEWIFEIKLDGYRALAYVEKSQVNLYSRNKNSFNKNYAPIVEELKGLRTQAILDGEICVVNKSGKSEFELLKNYLNTPHEGLCYFVFDLLYFQGKDLRRSPLIERKALLKELLTQLKSPIILYADHVEKKGIAFFNATVKKNLEGIVGKRKNSEYLSKRSPDWVKIKTHLRQEVVIGGFTKPKGSREKFGALMIGVYDKKNKLQYSGHVGGGFDRKALAEVYSELEPLIQKNCPFEIVPKGNDVVTWVKPKLLCEISFAEWTKDKIARQPIFHGLRMDKNPKQVVQEIPKEIVQEKGITLSNLDKIYWEEESYTKGDLIHYYEAIAPTILPFLKNRPVMLVRYPNGIDGENFHQKNIEYPPSWMETIEIQHETKKDRYILIQDKRTLLYVANLGSIELHPWLSHVGSLEAPDFLAVDLDPEDVPFKQMVETANFVHEFLDELKVPNYCKTSGGRGLHIYIPLKAKYPFEQTEKFAELLAHIVADQLPIISLERSKKKRQKKIYFDYLQNRHGGVTMVSPYSVRGRPHATVSTPLEWKEVNAKLDPQKFTIKTVPKRMAKMADPFKDLFKGTINMKAILKKLSKD